MASIQLTVVTPEGKPFEGEIDRVIVRTSGGDVCIMARHIDYAAALGDGEARITLANGSVRKAHIVGGMLHTSGDAVQIITSSFVWKD